MRRYFFDIRDGGFFFDSVGVNLESFDDARTHAASFLRQQLTEKVDTLWSDGGWQIEVRDEVGLVLFTVSLVMTEAPSIRRAR